MPEFPAWALALALAWAERAVQNLARQNLSELVYAELATP
jgi:hypothetical protein